MLNRVVDHTQRLIAAKNFNRLPRENEEFAEGSDALKKSIAKDPTAFKAKVEALLEKADANSKVLVGGFVHLNSSKLSRLRDELAQIGASGRGGLPNNVKPGANLNEEKQEEKSSPSRRGQITFSRPRILEELDR